MIKTPPQITEVTFWKLTCSWHSWQQKSCQRHQAKQEQYLPRYVLLVAQPGGVGVLCPDTVHGVLCLRGRPAVHLERSGYPLKGVSLNPSLGQTTITHLKRKNPFYSKRIFAVLSHWSLQRRAVQTQAAPKASCDLAALSRGWGSSVATSGPRGNTVQPFLNGQIVTVVAGGHCQFQPSSSVTFMSLMRQCRAPEHHTMCLSIHTL